MNALSRQRRSTTLMLALIASLAAHGAVLFAWPQLRDAGGHVEVLEVRLMPAEPPRVVQTPAPMMREHAPEKRAPRRDAGKAPRAEAPIPAPTPRVLALPQSAATANPAFVTPQPPGGETQPEPQLRQDTARVAPSTQGPPAAAVTPPAFNAAYLNNPQPVYPASARRRGEQGTVMLKVLVSREGAAASVSVDRSSGSPTLDQSALEAVKAWRFLPARQGAQNVEAWVLVPVVFRLQG